MVGIKIRRYGYTRVVCGVVVSVVLCAALRYAGVDLGTYSSDVGAATNNIYYVDDADGDDGNNGLSQGGAWKSLVNVRSTVFQPGDRILFKAGGIWDAEGVGVSLQGSGTGESPIVVDEYGRANSSQRKPIIHGGGTSTVRMIGVLGYHAVSGTIELAERSYWEINNLEITNFNPMESAVDVSEHRVGILVYDTNIGVETEAAFAAHIQSYLNNPQNHIYIRGNYIHDVVSNTREAGDYYTSSYKVTGGIIVAGRVNDVVIEENRIEDVSISGIKVGTVSVYGGEAGVRAVMVNTGIIIRNNYLDTIFGDGIVVSHAIGSLIEYNTVFRHCAGLTSDTGIENYYAGIWSWGTSGTIIQYNEVAYGEYGNTDGSAFDVDWYNYGTLIQHNYTHDNRRFLMLLLNSENTTVRYNVSINDNKLGRPAPMVSYEPRDSLGAPLFHNNLIYLGEEFEYVQMFSSSVRPPGETELVRDHYAKIFNNMFIMRGVGGQFLEPSRTFFAGNVDNNMTYPYALWDMSNFGQGVVHGNKFKPAIFENESDVAVAPAGIITAPSTFDTSLLNGLRLSPRSHAIKAGVNVDARSYHSPATKDFFGNSLMGAVTPDIGMGRFAGVRDTSVGEPVVLSEHLTDLATQSLDGISEVSSDPGSDTYQFGLDAVYNGRNAKNHLFFGDFFARIVGVANNGSVKIVMDGSTGVDRVATPNSSVWGATNDSLANDFVGMYESGGVDFFQQRLRFNKDNIETATWYTGMVPGYSGNYLTATLSDNIARERTVEYTAEIGLLNVSDWVRASGNPACNSVRNCLSNANTQVNPNNYLFDSRNAFWFMNGADGAFNWVSMGRYRNTAAEPLTYGKLSYMATSNDYYVRVRPTMYLKADVQVTGTGTLDDPYVVFGDSYYYDDDQLDIPDILPPNAGLSMGLLPQFAVEERSISAMIAIGIICTVVFGRGLARRWLRKVL